jgi:hypothetical protein
MPKKPSMVGDQENIKARHDWEEQGKAEAKAEEEHQRQKEEGTKEEER